MMLLLLIASLVFVGIHVLPSTPVRVAVVNAAGERTWIIVFSLVSIICLVWMVMTFNRTAPGAPFYAVPGWLRYLVALLVLDALLLVVIGLITPGDPTQIGPGRGKMGTGEGYGIRRVTRHPFMFGAGLWAVAHMLGNPNLRDWIFFGALALLSWGGALAQDRRNLARRGEAFERYLQRTSMLPFAAILGGRNEFKMAEIGWWRLAVALVVFIGLLHGHGGLFGVLPLPPT